MEKVVDRPVPDRKKAAIKAGVFLLFIVVAIFVVKFTPVKNYLNQASLKQFLDSAGFWAPLAYIVFYAAGV